MALSKQQALVELNQNYKQWKKGTLAHHNNPKACSNITNDTYIFLSNQFKMWINSNASVSGGPGSSVSGGRGVKHFTARWLSDYRHNFIWHFRLE